MCELIQHARDELSHNKLHNNDTGHLPRLDFDQRQGRYHDSKTADLLMNTNNFI